MADLATAGKVLSESELKSFLKCSQYHFYGGRQEVPVVLSVVKATVELMMANAVEESIEAPSMAFLPYLQKTIGKLNLRRLYLEGEIFDITNKSIFALTEFFNIVNYKVYGPLLGPSYYRVKISKTPLDIRISTILQRKGAQELIGIYFSPYTLRHHMLNDPIPYLQLRLLEKFGKDHFNRNTSSMFIIGIDKNGEVIVHSVGNKDFKEESYAVIRSAVQSIEMGFHFPLNPCQHFCEFKDKCFPYKKS